MHKLSKLTPYFIAASMVFSGAALAQDNFSVKFSDSAWNGETIPTGQHCKLQDGNGSTPALSISGIPAGADRIILSFNDESYEPMNNGGHGVLSYKLDAATTSVEIPSVAGHTNDLPAPFSIAKENATSGDFKSDGYMPPCSGGRGNTYSVDVIAQDAAGATLATQHVTMGKY